MYQIKFYGLGGQGAVTAAKLLSAATSLYEGNYAITVPAYGHERRGAPVYANVIADSIPVKQNCFVYEPDIVLIMDDKIPDKQVNVREGIHDDTILILNTQNRQIAEEYREKYGFHTVWYVDAVHIALDTIEKNIPNIAMLGALAKTGFVSVEALEKAIDDFFGVKAAKKNKETVRRAYQDAESL